MNMLELSAALDAVRRSIVICRSVQADLITSDTLAKKDKSPVTIADLAVQAVILHELHKAFPDIPFVGEEDAAELRENADLLERVTHFARLAAPDLTPETVCEAIDRGNHGGGPTGTFWTLDPIDGTKGYLRRQQYAIALALITDGEPVLGILGCPALEGGRLFTAQKGKGIQSCPVAAESESDAITLTPTPAPMRFCESVESAHSDQDQSARIAEAIGISDAPLRIDSQCKYAVLGQSQAAVYLRLPTRADYEEKIWDHAAGCLLVTEAGGTVTDINGKPLDFSQGRTLATNKGVVASVPPANHSKVIEAVKANFTVAT